MYFSLADFECRIIEDNIEKINNLRRDKWIVEGKIRKWVDNKFTFS